MAVRGLFLDLYGTLTDGLKESIIEACESVVRDHEIAATAAAFNETWGGILWNLARDARHERFKRLLDLEAESLVAAARTHGVELDPWPYVHRLESYWARPAAHADVVPFVESLNLPVCIVSNADRGNAETALEHMGVSVRYVVTSEDARSYKPNPEIFQLAFQLTGWSPAETMHVGDSPHSDVTPARELGLTAGLIRRETSPWDPGGDDAHHEFDHLTQLLEFLHA